MVRSRGAIVNHAAKVQKYIDSVLLLAVFFSFFLIVILLPHPLMPTTCPLASRISSLLFFFCFVQNKTS